VRQFFHTLAAALARLSRREQRLVAALGAVALLGAVYVLMLEPFLTSRERAGRRIEVLRDDIQVMQGLARRIEALETQSKDADASGAANAGFSLFSFIDKATMSAVSRDAVASMNPSKRPVRQGFEENAVELRLSSVTLPEVVGLLEKIESANQPVYVKRVELKRRYDDGGRFDVIIVAGSVSRT